MDHILEGFFDELEKLATADASTIFDDDRLIPPKTFLRIKKGKAYLEKSASYVPGFLDLAGLGVLATPTVYDVTTGKRPSHKMSRAAELTGLGLLGVSVLAHMKGMR